jgi:tetratricopeptide (TPR) repeat protein
VTTGRDRLTAGRYAEAIAELERTTGAERSQARLLLARAQRETGALAAAEATAKALLGDKDAAIVAGARVELAAARRLQGRGAEARADLAAAVAAAPGDRALRTAYMQVLHERGAVEDARKLAMLTIDEWEDAGRMSDEAKAKAKFDVEDATQVYYLAEAARLIDDVDFANQCYDGAIDLAPELAEAGLGGAELNMSNYNNGDAETYLEDVLKVNPHHADANAMMAAVVLATTYEMDRARTHLQAALEVDPGNARALAVRASIEIDRNEWDAAEATIAAGLKVNPEDTTLIAQQATIVWLRDDLPAYEGLKKRALAINPAFSEFFAIVARSAEREHRYVAAVELGKEAVALVPTDYTAMGEVGLGYLRLGMEKEGKEWLDKAWKGDQYNVRVYNTRNLYSDVIAKDYVFRDSKHFRVRYPRAEVEVLQPQIEPMLEKAFADMVKRYGFTPKTPVIVEMYADADAYAIRTVGLPNLSALGVCFGQVITALSPSTGDLNWGMVLWHELGHVFAIQASDSRVPRWFTEGLSEYETLIARPEWRRENDSDLYGAVMDKKLPSVAVLNHQFMQPDQNAVVVAYYMSAVTIEYIAQTYGFPKINEALRLFAKGKETPEVITAITGKSVEAFDAEFLAYVMKRLAPYQGTFHLPRVASDDITTLEIAAENHPDDAQVHVDLALARYAAGDAGGTRAELELALKIDPKHAAARYLSAELTLRTGDPKAAEAMYRDLVATGVDNFDIRVRLASFAQGAGDEAGYVAQLCAAKRLDPERSYPYQELAQYYGSKGQTDKQLAELEHYAMLEQMELEPVKTLTIGYAKAGKFAKARTYGELAMYIAPGDPEVLLALGRAYNELGAYADGLRTFDTALGLTPPLRRPAQAHVGRAAALLGLGKKADAKAAVAKALSTEASNKDALALQEKLK